MMKKNQYVKPIVEVNVLEPVEMMATSTGPSISENPANPGIPAGSNMNSGWDLW